MSRWTATRLPSTRSRFSAMPGSFWCRTVRHIAIAGTAQRFLQPGLTHRWHQAQRSGMVDGCAVYPPRAPACSRATTACAGVSRLGGLTAALDPVM